MRKIFIDLEMNPIKTVWTTSGRRVKNEIIEIGAVMLDEDDMEISSFDEYVRPVKNEYIVDKISRLTGINTRTVMKADPLPNVLKRFLQWCGDDYVIYSWSESDYIQLSKEVELKNITSKDFEGLERLLMPETWKDYQIEYMNHFNFERLMSLKDAINMAGLDFQGRAHGALADARNTSYLYQEAKSSRFSQMMKEIRAGREEFTVSLGALFDFSQLAG